MAVASTVEYALLGLLRQQAQSGYDLRKVFSTTPMRHFSDSPGSIYPALQRLEKRGWVGSAAEKNDARKRRVFSPTHAGTGALIAWLEGPVTREDVIWRLDETLLRFAFLDGNVKRSVTLRFVEQFERELAAYVRELEEHEKAFVPNARRSTGYLAFQSGVESYQARLEWLRRVRKQFLEVVR
jgi:DNA-binding PadR family transcriptional regulator